MLVSSRLTSLRAIFTTLVVAVALLGITAPAAQAAGTATWTGTNSELWSDPGNWGGVAPTPGTDLVFPAGAIRTTAVNDLAPGTSFGSITIAGAGYEISGSSLKLTGALSSTYTSGTSVSGIDVDLGTATVAVAAGGALSLTGTVSGSSGLSVTGGGVLEVNGSVSGSVNLVGGTLAGAGTLNGSGITATASSTVAPGRQNAPGILRYSANAGLTLPSSSTFRVDLDGPTLGTGYDQLKLTSGSALFNPNGATLDIDLGYLPAVNTSFQIVSQAFGSPITGRFNGISQFGSVTAGPVTFSVGYFNSGIILTVVAVNVPTRTWDGGGATSNWSEAANWVGDVAPSLAAALVFPAGSSKLASVNDLPGLRVPSLTIGAPEYQLSGAAIELLGTARATYSSGTSSIDVGLKVDATRSVEVDAGGTFAITSPISGIGGLTKTSAGNLRLTSGATSYTGATTVSGGRLTVDGSIASSSSVQVAAGTTLTGNGTVPALSVSGTLSPRGLGSGDLSLASGSSMSVALAEDDNDQVDVTGTVQLSDSTLAPSIDYVPTIGDSFTIVDNDGTDAIFGTFAGLPEGAYLTVGGVRLQISYVGGSGNDIVLTAALAPTSTSVSSSAPSGVTGEPVTFTATTTSEGSAVPDGSTRFLIGDDQVQAPTAVDAAGKVTFTTNSLPSGDTTVTAEYIGTAVHATSSGSRVHSVGKSGTTTTVKIGATALIATVMPAAPGGGTPTGTVTFTADDKPVGEAALVDGVATLSKSLVTGKPVTVRATYAGSSDYVMSSATARRTDPAITGRAKASRAKSARGWYRTPVQISFTCTAGSASLARPCPTPVKISRSGRAIAVLGTATAADGGTATVKVTVNIDRKAPSLRVKRTGNRLRCQAKDSLSGVASCKITKKTRAKGVVAWVAKAKDRAGNVTTKRGKYKKR